MTLTTTSVNRNDVTAGGGIWSEADTVMLFNSGVNNNTATSIGGGIYNNGGSVTLDRSSTVKSNTPNNIAP